jgi:hypothetical protein
MAFCTNHTISILFCFAEPARMSVGVTLSLFFKDQNFLSCSSSSSSCPAKFLIPLPQEKTGEGGCQSEQVEVKKFVFHHFIHLPSRVNSSPFFSPTTLVYAHIIELLNSHRHLHANKEL